MAWERVGAALSLPFAGVHIVEATKQVYRAIPAHRERTRLIPSLEPVLVPSSTASGIAKLKGGPRLARAHHIDRFSHSHASRDTPRLTLTHSPD